MTGSVIRNVEVERPSGAVGRLWWLPAGGQGNGLDDAGWAPLADLYPEAVSPVLEALRVAGAAGYVAPVRGRRLESHGRPPVPGRRPGFRLWVGVSTYQTAVDAVASVLRTLGSGRVPGTGVYGRTVTTCVFCGEPVELRPTAAGRLARSVSC